MGSRCVSILKTMLARASQVQSKRPKKASQSLSLGPLQGESSAQTSGLVLSVASGGGSGREGAPPNEAKSELYNEIIQYNSEWCWVYQFQYFRVCFFFLDIFGYLSMNSFINDSSI